MPNSQNPYTEAAAEAAELTNKELAGEIAMFSPMSRSLVDRLLPLKRDKVAFLELMRLVEKEKNEELRIVALKENIGKYGSVVFKLLKFLV